MVSTQQTPSAYRRLLQEEPPASHPSVEQRHLSASVVDRLEHNVTDSSMRSVEYGSSRRLGRIGSIRQIFSQTPVNTLSILAKRKKYVVSNNNALRGGLYNPKAETLNTFKGWLPLIRVSAKQIAPTELFAHLRQVIHAADQQADAKDWGAIKTILSACTTQTLNEAIALALPQDIVAVYSEIFSSLVETANTPPLPKRYKLSQQYMKHNHADWNDKTLNLVKRLIDGLNKRATMIMDRQYSIVKRMTLLQQMRDQAEYYSDKIEMPQPVDEDSTLISYDEEASLIHYLNTKLDSLK